MLVLLPTVLELLDETVERPVEVRAVTSARIRWPTSSERTPYVGPLAPATLTQSVPVELQRCHWNPNDVGVGDQVPRKTRSSSPTVAVPLTAGRTEFVGPDFEWTTSVASDVALLLPSVFDAVTSTRSVLPTSPATGEYVCFVAPVMSPHVLPSDAQRRHW